MTERVLGPTGSRRRRRFMIGPFLLIAACALMFTAGAQAVHDDGLFELDRNAVDDGFVGASGGEDWNLVCPTTTPVGTAPGCLGGTAAAVSRFVTDAPNSTIFTQGGSKDDLDTTQWRHTDGSVPDKDDLLHGFAARIGDNLYFGADRAAANGDAQIGIWFFQNQVGPVAGGLFGPSQHKDGDILVLSDFTKGGTLPTVRVFEWNGPGGDIPGVGEINGTIHLLFGTTATPQDCVGTPLSNDPACATVNTASTPSPWAFDPKSGPDNSFGPGMFYEGGIDLGFLGVADECFSSFLIETRSSQSVDAVLKDFVAGQFAQCGSSTLTTPKLGDGTTNVPAAGTSITTAGSIQVKDEAQVTVNGTSTYGGSVSFHLCGPTPLTDANYTLCTSGGASIGSAKPVSGPSPSTVTSDAATITKVGRYCWRGDYSGDAVKGVPGSSDSAVGECFKVLPVQPTLSTQAVDANGAAITTAVPFGTTIYDTANLSGTAPKPGSGGLGGGDPSIDPVTAGGPAGGSITFKLYQSDCTTLATGFPAAGISVTVSGDNAAYGGPPTVGFQPQAPGVYHWRAEYVSDDGNTLGATHNGACSDSNEQVTVQQLQPAISTAQTFTIKDSATITVGAGAGNLAGNVRFRLYNNATCDPGTGNVNLLYDSGAVAVSGASPQTVESGATTITTSKPVLSWLVEYTSTNTGHKNVASACNTENASLSIDNG